MDYPQTAAKTPYFMELNVNLLKPFYRYVYQCSPNRYISALLVKYDGDSELNRTQNMDTCNGTDLFGTCRGLTLVVISPHYSLTCAVMSSGHRFHHFH